MTTHAGKNNFEINRNSNPKRTYVGLRLRMHSNKYKMLNKYFCSDTLYYYVCGKLIQCSIFMHTMVFDMMIFWSLDKIPYEKIQKIAENRT